jgi:hypothetical protein
MYIYTHLHLYIQMERNFNQLLLPTTDSGTLRVHSEDRCSLLNMQVWKRKYAASFVSLSVEPYDLQETCTGRETCV